MKSWNDILKMRFATGSEADRWKVGRLSRHELAAHCTQYGPVISLLPRHDVYAEELLGLPVILDKTLPDDVVLIVDRNGKELGKIKVE